MTARSKISLALLALVTALVLVPLAAAHAELSPEEAKAGSTQRFVLSVENESADAAFVKVVAQFPESVPTATFVQVPGWTRSVTTKPLDTPVTGPDGETITERIDTVTWEGGSVGPGEEAEFPFSFLVPEQPGATLFFPTLQTYDDGTVVRWIGAPGSEEPAPGILITEATGGGGGTTTESVTTTVATTVTTEAESTTEADTTETIAAVPVSDEDDGSSWPLYLGLLALLAALAGLGYWLYKRNQDDQEPPADDLGGPGGPSGGPPPVDPAAPSGGAAMPGGGQAPAPPEAETQLIEPPDSQATQRIEPDDWQQR
jgi:uncharacterized protein